MAADASLPIQAGRVSVALRTRNAGPQSALWIWAGSTTLRLAGTTVPATSVAPGA